MNKMKEAIFYLENGGNFFKRIFCPHVWSTNPRLGGQKEIVIADVPSGQFLGYIISLEIMVCTICERRSFYIFKTWKECPLKKVNK